MSRRNEALMMNNSGLVKVTYMAGLAKRITPFYSGFCWLISYIVLSLVSARFIFWTHTWNFSWMPEGLPGVFMFFFGVVYIGIGPFCILFCASIHEMTKIRHLDVCRPLLVFLRDFARGHYTAEYLLNGILAFCLVYGALVGYTNLKPAIPLLNPALYDDLFFRCDACMLQVLSLGGVITIPRHHMITVFFDKIYFHIWTLACITLVMSFRNPASFWRFTAAWCLAFGFSLPISILFPSLGPAFYQPELFTQLSDANSAKAMAGLWANYLSFKTDPYNTSIVSANGIVAMPSLHIALVYLSVIKLGKLFPRLRLILWGVLVLYIIATVYLGWHYLSDGIVGILLGWFAYKISARWFYEKIDQEGLNDSQKSINLGA